MVVFGSLRQARGGGRFLDEVCCFLVEDAREGVFWLRKLRCLLLFFYSIFIIN